MAGGIRDSSLTRVQPFLSALIESDPSGSSWLGELLAATPFGKASLGSLLDDPGSLRPTVSSIGARGRLRCFEYPVDPPRDLLLWFIDNPDQLEWPAKKDFLEETLTQRRSLIDDDPPGSRKAAQQRARELATTKSPGAREWWRFEGTSMIDCLLETEKLVITFEGKRTEGLSAATDWYPKRSQLVRNLEAAKAVAGDSREWASLLLTEQPIPEGTAAGLDAVISESAPHLDATERASLSDSYLGNLTWSEACEAVGMDFGSLPDTKDDL